MNPFMILFFMIYNIVMPKIYIIFSVTYFFYAYMKDHLLFELNTWFGFIIAVILGFTFELLISETIFKITYKRFMDRVSDIEPFIATTISTFFFSFISIVLSIIILDYIISLRLF